MTENVLISQAIATIFFPKWMKFPNPYVKYLITVATNNSIFFKILIIRNFVSCESLNKFFLMVILICGYFMSIIKKIIKQKARQYHYYDTKS